MKKTQTKYLSVSLEIATALIECIESNCVDLMYNDEFKNRINALRKCVDDMYAVDEGYEVSDMYLTVECKPMQPPNPADINKHSTASKKIL